MSNQFLVPTGAAIPANILALFGQPPLLSDESKTQYDELLCGFAGSVEARDIIEWFWVKDIADLTWEILRMRRFKVGIIDVAKKSALEAIMLSLTETGEILSFDLNISKRLAAQWFTDAKAKEEIFALLARHDLNAEAIAAQAFMLRCTELEAAERMLASAEKRRNETLREISLRREIVARQLREKSDRVIDTENSEIPHISAPPIDHRDRITEGQHSVTRGKS
jgi:hypothetical protein